MYSVKFPCKEHPWDLKYVPYIQLFTVSMLIHIPNMHLGIFNKKILYPSAPYIRIHYKQVLLYRINV